VWQVAMGVAGTPTAARAMEAAVVAEAAAAVVVALATVGARRF